MSVSVYGLEAAEHLPLPASDVGEASAMLHEVGKHLFCMLCYDCWMPGFGVLHVILTLLQASQMLLHIEASVFCSCANHLRSHESVCTLLHVLVHPCLMVDWY
jgi:hypothetical protein